MLLLLSAGDVQRDLPAAHAAKFILVVRGKARLRSAYGRFDLAQGSWVAFDAGEVSLATDLRNAVVLALIVEPELTGWFHALPTAPVFMIGSGQAPVLAVRAALRTWRMALAGEAGAESGPRLHAAMRMLQDQPEALVERCPGYKAAHRRETYLRMQRARLQLLGGIEKRPRIADVAAGTGLSLWYFSKLFHALFGTSPMRYGLESRLAHARALVADTKLEIADIGTMCGFENACSFSRAFRSRYAESASALRARIAAQGQGRGPLARPA